MPGAARAFDWHVAPGGVDGADGSEAAPLETLAHAISRAAEGDRILLRRGGCYAASGVEIGRSLTVAAYGQGVNPILTASFELPLPGSWAQNAAVRTGEIAERVLACYVDGRFVPLARYPNQGFLQIDNDDDPDRIVDAELAERAGVAAGRWTGAQVRWRRWSWWWETRPIESHSAVDTLELGEEGRFDDPFSDPGSGYFIDDDLDELDAPGEWVWEDGRLYLYPPDWAEPDSMEVRVVTSAETGVTASGASFADVQFQRFAGTALQLSRGPVRIERCTFAEIETDAIRYTWDAQPFTVRGSVFRDVRNVAIQGWADAAGPAGTRIERNLFLRIGMQPGYGGSGSWHAAGVILGNANAATFQLNRVIDTGYAGVILGSDGQTVARNVFVRTMGTLNDGAAVYTNCNASEIRENIILDTIGALDTSHPWYPLGHGIWPEFLSDFRDSVIVDNTIYGSSGHGIMLPNNFHCEIARNVAVDNRRAGLGLSGDAGDAQQHVIRANTLAAVVPSRRIQRPENLSPWWLPPYEPPTPVALSYEPAVDYGQMDETCFIAPAEGAGVIRAEGQDDFDSLADWCAAASWASEAGSRVVRGHAILLFNDTEASVEMPVPEGAWTHPDGSPVEGALSLEPFRSAVLVSAQQTGTEPAYRAASGIDYRSDTPTSAPLTPEPEIAVTRAGAPIADGGSDELGPIALGAAHALVYTIANAGGVALHLTLPVAIEGQRGCEVAVEREPAAEIPSGGATELALSVRPTAPGAWSFGVSFATDDADENPCDWTVRGTASQAIDGGSDGGEPGIDGGEPGSDGPGQGVRGGCGCSGARPGQGLIALVGLLGLCRRRAELLGG
ncbi:MAG: right-handed parallel beta-helix repeat-containing protein [Deltaproteobacteria bacterium]|nr:right-handed parallel beta-helix repeat-containing protein [Deltaproteobacteria bacterium]